MKKANTLLKAHAPCTTFLYKKENYSKTDTLYAKRLQGDRK
jgi:hypothetical protein